jgi:hypothetical protein
MLSRYLTGIKRDFTADISPYPARKPGEASSSIAGTSQPRKE